MNDLDTAAAAALTVLTRNPSLVIGLTFVGRDWEVTAVEDLDAWPEADLVVVDVGSTTEGLARLRQLDGGPSQPPAALIIGDDDAQTSGSQHLLLRPFTVDELTGCIDALLGGEVAAASALGHDDADRSPQAPVTEGDQTASAHEVRPGARPGARTTLRGWVDRLGSRRKDRPQGADSAVWTTHEPLATPKEPAREPDAREAEAEPSGGEVDLVIDLLTEEEAERGSQVAHPDGGRTHTPFTDPEGAVTRTGAVQRAASRFTARNREASTPEAEMRRRLAEVITAGSELESLVHDLPLLRSLEGVATLVVEEVRELLNADTAAYLARHEDGFYILASIGLSKVERRLVAPLDQPMLAEVDATGGGLLIDPIDAAHAAVSGIGGAHTESFMAASVAAGSGRFGLLVAGRDRPLTEPDLDRLVDLAREAAPGLAVAQLLRRLGALVIDRSGKEPRAQPVSRGDLGVRLLSVDH